MICSIRDWLVSMFYHGMLEFERQVLESVALKMTGKEQLKFQKQLEWVTKVQVDPFRTCLSLIMDRKKAQCARIETKEGLILARVSGSLDGQSLTAEVGLCNGLLYAIVTDRPLSRHDRERKSFRVVDVRLYPRIAPVASDWMELTSKSEELSKIQIHVLRPEERWLHPWDSAWYLCLADIGSEYYILQRCDSKGKLFLLDYINHEIVLSSDVPLALMEYAYSHGNWIDDANALQRFIDTERCKGVSISSTSD